jgi:hypothetical protein
MLSKYQWPAIAATQMPAMHAAAEARNLWRWLSIAAL